ncbi:MAG: TolC family protein [Campylobacterales bacterium]
MKNKIILLSIFSVISLNAEVLTFSKAYELALENTHSLKASIFKSEGAKERVNQAKSQLYPQINLSASYKKTEYKYNKNYNATEDTINQGLINYTLSLKQSIYNANIYAGISLEKSKNELYKVGVELEKDELAQKVFQTYLDVLKINNKIELDKAYLRYAKSRLDELTKKYDMFMASKMDLLEMKVDYKSAQIDLKKDKKLFIVNRLKLKQLIGNYKYELPSIKPDEHILSTIALIKSSINKSGDFANNLQLLKAKLSVEVAKKDVHNAFVAHYPTLDLQASYSGYETDDPTSDSLYKDVKSVMLLFNLPIYSGGRTSSRVSELQYNVQSALEEYEDTKKQIEVIYDENLALLDASIESVSMYQEALVSAELYSESIEQGYEHGLKSIIDVNDAKNKQYNVKYKYIENIYDLVNSYIGLLIVTNDFKNISLLDKLVK